MIACPGWLGGDDGETCDNSIVYLVSTPSFIIELMVASRDGLIVLRAHVKIENKNQ